MKQYLEIAKIINTHGIRGDLKLDIWCDSPAVMKKIKTLYLDPEGKQPLAVSGARMHDRFLLLHAEGIDTPEEGAKYKEKILYAFRDDVPRRKGDYFIADLIGLPVFDADTGKQLGTLHDVIENPANSLYEVQTASGMVLVPAIAQFVTRIDPESGIEIRPIPGLFDAGIPEEDLT